MSDARDICHHYLRYARGLSFNLIFFYCTVSVPLRGMRALLTGSCVLIESFVGVVGRPSRADTTHTRSCGWDHTVWRVGDAPGRAIDAPKRRTLGEVHTHGGIRMLPFTQKMVYLGVTCTHTAVHATRRLPTICQRPLSHRAWLPLDPQRPRSHQKAHAACLSEPPPAVLTAGRRRTSRPRVGRLPACAVRCATARRARG